MTHSTPELVKAVIVSQQLNLLSIYDTAKSTKVYTHKGPPDELCAKLDEALSMFRGVVRVEAERYRSEGGKKGKLDEPLCWLLTGHLDGYGAPAAAAPAASVNLDPLARAVADLAAQVAELKAKAMNGPDLEEEEEEEEEDDPAVLAMEERKLALIERGVNLGEELARKWLKIPGQAPAAPVNGQAAAAPPGLNGAEPVADMTADEARELLTAIARFRKTDPAMFASVKDQLLGTYGNGQA